MSKKVVVLLSGGMDSVTLLHRHVKAGDEVRAISFNYGQRHERELFEAAYQAGLLDVPHTVVDLTSLAKVLPGSSQTDKSVDVPEGHYSEENMKLTVVPNRNMILLSIAVGHAIAHKFDAVSFAAHAGDHAIYPDCRNEFVEALQDAVNLCDWSSIDLLRPYVNLTKSDIASNGGLLQVDYSRTWSCYVGGKLHCGKCGTCTERREAFHLAGLVDPTEYEATAPTLAECVSANWFKKE